LSADRLALTGFTSNCLQGAGAADGAANTAELQARNHHSAVPTLISIGEITGVGAQLGKPAAPGQCAWLTETSDQMMSVKDHNAGPSRPGGKSNNVSASRRAPQASGHSSGSNLTFESEAGFPPDWSHASLAHANRYLHHSQAR
jgi:hypothetical protein